MREFKGKLQYVGSKLCMTLAWVSVSVFFLWSAGALYHLTFLPYALRSLCAAAYFVGGIWLFVRLKNPDKWLALAAASIVLVYLITLVQRPSNDRNWDLSQSLTTRVEVGDKHVVIHGFRHCNYRTETDFDVRYQTIEFKLDQVQSVWFLVQKFSPLEGLAHTFVSFELQTDVGPQYFSVSVEIRREVGEVYSPIRGLYRQFELLYVIGDERDLIGSRTVVRELDRVHMYRVNATPQQVQRLLLDIAERINKLENEPEFYHTFLNNCTNGIVFHTYDLTPEPINWLDPRIVMPGYSDRFAFEKKLIGKDGQTFAELQDQCRIDQVARNAGLVEQFSEAIRAPMSQ
jgi:hypothetical protein